MADRLIPEEARKAAEEAMVAFFAGRKGDEHGLDVMLNAAAPHIARAARIDELRLMIGNCIGVGPHDSELAVTMRTLQERIAELEAIRDLLGRVER